MTDMDYYPDEFYMVDTASESSGEDDDDCSFELSMPTPKPTVDNGGAGKTVDGLSKAKKDRALASASAAGKLPTVTLAFRQAMQKARMEQKLTQDQLAKKLNVKSAIIQSYENGKVVPDGATESKIRRALKMPGRNAIRTKG
jgi:ribosome-binding protein aMBF1 (putative translation factor)